MNLNLHSNEFSLEESVGFYRNLLNQMPDLVFQLTLFPDNELEFSYINASVISIFDLNRNEIIAHPKEVISKKIYSKDRESFFDSFFSAKSERKYWSHEFRVHCKNELVWYKIAANIILDENGNAVFYGRLTDINDIKIRELKVVESEARYQFALEASKNGIWDYNIKTEQVFFSKESLDIIQYDYEDNLTTNYLWDERIHPEDLESYLESIELHKQDKIPFFENTKRVLAKDGSYKWVLSRGKIIEREEDGTPVRIIGTHTDVSSEKEKESELIRNLEIINEQNNRLLNFAHIVSHNLRSHTGNFEMLLNIIDNEVDEVTRDECYSYLRTTSKALSDTIEHLKELLDIHSALIHKKEHLNLNVFLNQTLEVLSKEIKDNKVEIVNKIGEKETVNFNPAYLESLFLNFTTNAIKYSHPERNPKISYSVVRENNQMVLLVEDNGLGINLEKHRQKLFGMYKTFHRNENARGIGLFITKNQIESMGGSIEVESKVNVGTTFKIKFNDEI